MIFSIGFICLIIGAILHRIGTFHYGPESDVAELIGALLVLFGLVMLIVSLCILSFRYLP